MLTGFAANVPTMKLVKVRDTTSRRTSVQFRMFIEVRSTNTHALLAAFDEQGRNVLQVIAGAPASIMEQGSRARDWNALTPQEQDVTIGFLRTKGSALAYQKVLTNQGRTSKEGLDIELQNMPSPILGATVANKQLDAFQEDIDTAAKRAVRLPWMETASDVRARIENQAPQEYNEQQKAKPTNRPEAPRRPVSTGQEF